MKNLLALVFVMIVFSISCQNPKSDNASKTNAKTASPAPAKVVREFDPLPNDILMRLWNECTLIDYIFHTLPFSMNQGEQASIRTNLTYVDQNVQPNIPAACKGKAIARQFYQIEGEIIYEADVYYSEGCQFYVFYDGDKKYANKMSADGIAFFQTMIAKAMGARQQMGQ